MARLQILELPEGSGDDRPPFVLVIDQCVPQRVALGSDVPFRDYWQDIAQQIGARGAIVTPDTVDIPANELTLTHVQEAADGNIMRLRVEPDLDGFADKVMAEVAKAQAEMADSLGRSRL